ncbi:hypothetical protein SNEBB_009084 [Seison nebaliae]|nr:hypothetical protein SNEBB_009084 [Seison nebaliae]
MSPTPPKLPFRPPRTSKCRLIKWLSDDCSDIFIKVDDAELTDDENSSFDGTSDFSSIPPVVLCSLETARNRNNSLASQLSPDGITLTGLNDEEVIFTSTPVKDEGLPSDSEIESNTSNASHLLLTQVNDISLIHEIERYFASTNIARFSQLKEEMIFDEDESYDDVSRILNYGENQANESRQNNLFARPTRSFEECETTKTFQIVIESLDYGLPQDIWKQIFRNTLKMFNINIQKIIIDGQCADIIFQANDSVTMYGIINHIDNKRQAFHRIHCYSMETVKYKLMCAVNDLCENKRQLSIPRSKFVEFLRVNYSLTLRNSYLKYLKEIEVVSKSNSNSHHLQLNKEKILVHDFHSYISTFAYTIFCLRHTIMNVKSLSPNDFEKKFHYILPSVRISLSELSLIVHRLLTNHNGLIHVASLVDCIGDIGLFDSNNRSTESVNLEHLLSILQDVVFEYGGMPLVSNEKNQYKFFNKSIRWKRNDDAYNLGMDYHRNQNDFNKLKINYQYLKEKYPEAKTNYNLNLILRYHILKILIDASDNNNLLNFNTLSDQYLTRYHVDLKTAFNNQTDFVSYIQFYIMSVEILGNGKCIHFSLTHNAQLKRLSYDLELIFLIKRKKFLTFDEIKRYYKHIYQRQLTPTIYGLCEEKDLLQYIESSSIRRRNCDEKSFNLKNNNENYDKQLSTFQPNEIVFNLSSISFDMTQRILINNCFEKIFDILKKMKNFSCDFYFLPMHYQMVCDEQFPLMKIGFPSIIRFICDFAPSSHFSYSSKQIRLSNEQILIESFKRLSRKNSMTTLDNCYQLTHDYDFEKLIEDNPRIPDYFSLSKPTSSEFLKTILVKYSTFSYFLEDVDPSNNVVIGRYIPNIQALSILVPYVLTAISKHITQRYQQSTFIYTLFEMGETLKKSGIPITPLVEENCDILSPIQFHISDIVHVLETCLPPLQLELNSSKFHLEDILVNPLMKDLLKKHHISFVYRNGHYSVCLRIGFFIFHLVRSLIQKHNMILALTDLVKHYNGLSSHLTLYLTKEKDIDLFNKLLLSSPLILNCNDWYEVFHSSFGAGLFMERRNCIMMKNLS